MKRTNIRLILVAVILIVTSIFSGCQAISGMTNKVPEKYTEGIKYSRDFPDDTFEIYDDAVVFESNELFGAIIVTFGSEDDFDDVLDFYKDFFKDNEIVLLNEDEGRDEYYAKGFYEGYEFKLQIIEADGEYIKDLFECVVYLSTEEKDEAQASLKAEDTPTPIPSQTNESTPEPKATPTPKPATQEPKETDSNGETPLYTLPSGSWELRWVGSDTTVFNMDATLHINSDGTGTYYYYDYDGDDRGFFPFNYEINNGELTLEVSNGNIPYYAYLDDGVLHLIHQENGLEMYFSNWNEVYSTYPSESEFTAYGDWMYYEPETGYTETISFWPNGSGYVYNWGGTGENLLMFWEYEDGQFTFSDELGSEYTYGIVHRGEVFELHQLNGSVFFYNRVSRLDLYAGGYYMNETNEDDLADWSFSLYANGNYEGTLNESAISGSWFIDKETGRIAIELFEEYYYFNYHYDVEGLHFWDDSDTYYYYFLSVG